MNRCSSLGETLAEHQTGGGKLSKAGLMGGRLTEHGLLMVAGGGVKNGVEEATSCAVVVAIGLRIRSCKGSGVILEAKKTGSKPTSPNRSLLLRCKGGGNRDMPFSLQWW